MKKTIALLLALAFIVALFASCGGTPAATTTTPPTASTTPTDSGGTTEPVTPTGPSQSAITPPELPHAGDTLAVNADGTLKYDIDDRNYPLGFYDYELPLTEGNDTLVYWDPTIMPFFIVNTEGANGPYQTMLRETTGVNIEYQTVDYANAQQAFSVMLASHEFTDIMNGVGGPFGFWSAAGGGTASDMIDQKFFINIADYRAYAPNFMYQVPRYDYDPELISLIWLNDTMITGMGPYIENPLPGTGYGIRGDWLEQLDGAPKADEIVTYDQLHDILTRIKNESNMAEDGYPILFFANIELTNALFFGGMNTGLYLAAPMTKVIDGEVGFTMTQDIDYEALQLFMKWYDDGLISPLFTEVSTTDAAQAQLYGDGYAMAPVNPTEVGGFEKFNTRTPTARWDAMHGPKLTPDFEVKYGHGQGRYAYFGGGWCFATTGKNVPLAISYTDWFYSDEGSLLGSYGIEGDNYNSPNATFYYADDGSMLKTDFVINNSANQAIGWFMMSYQQIAFTEPIRHIHLASYAVEGGQRFVDMFYLWMEDYYTPTADGSNYDWPSTSAKATDEQQRDLNTFMTDTNTWFSENYAQFVDFSTPVTPETWDAYVTGLYAAGYARYQIIMQTVYDDYMAQREAQLNG